MQIVVLVMQICGTNSVSVFVHGLPKSAANTQETNT
jgi:hypothetical protein